MRTRGILSAVQLGLPFSRDDRPAPAPVARPAASPPPDRSVSPPQLPDTLTEHTPSRVRRRGPPPPADGPDRIVYVRHRRARRYVLRVDADGIVRVTIPRGGSRREAEAFARRHQAWIDLQRALAATQTIDVAARRALRDRARRELPPRLSELAAMHGLAIARISIRNQRTRWGSCGRDGHICLNWRLVLMPDWVRDYVLIHELMHLRRLDHSLAFWRLVAAACPEYERARRWLRAHGTSLLAAPRCLPHGPAAFGQDQPAFGTGRE